MLAVPVRLIYVYLTEYVLFLVISCDRILVAHHTD